MDLNQVRHVRRFNRTVTRRVGALEDSYLQRGRPLGEARLLFEIGRDGADIRTLRDRLGLDSGYLSRLLRSLEAQGLASVRPDAADARRRRVALTETGRAEFDAYDGLSDDLAESILAPLADEQRARLVAAMGDVERLIRAAAVEIRPETPTNADARWCVARYFEDLATRFETGFDAARTNPASGTEFAPPAGLFLVASLDGAPMGCGALRRIDDRTAEIKRMWTAPSARGLGIARRILRALESEARRTGHGILRLETNRSLPEAQALYRSEGYEEVAPFNDEPYAHHWFRKRLG